MVVKALMLMVSDLLWVGAVVKVLWSMLAYHDENGKLQNFKILRGGGSWGRGGVGGVSCPSKTSTPPPFLP